jgi:hypothetical protein
MKSIRVKPQRFEVSVLLQVFDSSVALEVEIKRVVQVWRRIPAMFKSDLLQLRLGSFTPLTVSSSSNSTIILFFFMTTSEQIHYTLEMHW